MATQTPAESSQVTFMKRSEFPNDFIFGTSSSAFQIEGAVDEDGRLPSIWDTFSKKYDLVTDGHSWADGVDHYHRYKEDVKIMKDIGLRSYRFSISWSRILPHGTKAGGENPAGIAFYNNLINELLANGIEPMVTLFHWDLPQALEDEYGGFLDRRIIVDFRDYADVCFREFGDRVKYWITLNEPWSFSYGGYAVAFLAPGRGYAPIVPYSLETGDLLPPTPFSAPPMDITPYSLPLGNPGTEPYIVSHHQLLAHGAAVKLYREKYQQNNKGQIGMALVSIWTEPYSAKREDKLAAERVLDFYFGWFMEPTVTGDYPATMRQYVGSRLPVFTPEESALLKGSYDFVGVNYYTASYVQDRTDIGPKDEGHYVTDPVLKYHHHSEDGKLIGELGGSTWLYVYPKGIHKLLTYIKEKYNNPRMFITENGLDEMNDPNKSLWESLYDYKRISYYHDHLLMIKKAIEEGVNVKGYFSWSVLDNFEWSQAFKSRFGFNYVDYKNGMARYPKLSAGWFKFLLT